MTVMTALQACTVRTMQEQLKTVYNSDQPLAVYACQAFLP